MFFILQRNPDPQGDGAAYFYLNHAKSAREAQERVDKAYQVFDELYADNKAMQSWRPHLIITQTVA